MSGEQAAQAAPEAGARGKVLLLGDPARDSYLLLDAPLIPDGGAEADWRKHGQWRSWVLPGGVDLIAGFMRDLGLAVTAAGPQSEGRARIQSLAELRFVAFDKKAPARYCKGDPNKRSQHCRVSARRGYQQIHEAASEDGLSGPATSAGDDRAPAPPPTAEPDIVVLADAGAGLRRDPELLEQWLASLRDRDGLPVILKMHLPLAEGAAWDCFRGLAKAERIVIVGAEDLRASGVAIDRCLSWDAVVRDLDKALSDAHSLLQELLLPNGRLILLFDAEAAAIVEADARGRATALRLVLDPALGEGDIDRRHDGDLIGKMSVFLAHLTAALTQESPLPCLAGAVRQAMTGLGCFARNAMLLTRREDDSGRLCLSYPVIGQATAAATPYVVLEDNLLGNGRNGRNLIAASPAGADLAALARRVVSLGTGALAGCPSARYGKLLTVDRTEIEGYRAIDRLLRRYLAEQDGCPVSIAVFGPPGSGKSFGVEQLLVPAGVPVKKFDLSQAEPSDLAGFFHEIRDINLTGKTPLCIFDEFDAKGRSLVAHFLAPMQNGSFRDGARVHPVGRGIFVFAGGTSRTYRSFTGSEEGAEERRLLERLKVPDFVSRLSGHIDIKGIDRSAEDDGLFVLRRAILLRAFVETHLPGILRASAKVAEIEAPVIEAFLTTRTYKHGARSLEQIVRMCGRAGGTRRLTASDLPKTEQLDMHVDAKDFDRIARRLRSGTG